MKKKDYIFELETSKQIYKKIRSFLQIAEKQKGEALFERLKLKIYIE